MTLEQLISDPELPSLPEAVIKLNSLISHDAPMTQISEVLIHDPALTLRTLELANSAWFKREKTIESVNEAISIIGLAALYQLIFATSVTRLFNDINPQQFTMKSFWQESVRTATLMQTLATYVNEPGQNLFTIGLTTYIGKLILATAGPYLAYKVYQRYDGKTVPLYEVEKEIIGYTHVEISAAIMERWKLPESFYLPIKYCYHPFDAPEPHAQVARLLHLAHYLQCSFYPDESGQTPPVYVLNPELINSLKIETTEFQRIVESAANLFDEAMILLGL